MEYCEGDVQQAIREIRRAYLLRKRRYEPGYKLSSERHKRIWRKAALICLENDIQDFEGFVEAQFREIDNPYPNVLTNTQQAIIRYQTYVQEVTEKGKAEIYVFSQMDSVMARARTGLSMRRYLQDEMELICPLIRYVVAITLDYLDIAEALKPEATAYARANSDVVEVLKARFPGVDACHQLV